MTATPDRRVPTPPSECDVLVIGAGISGLVAAMRVQRADPELQVEVIDIAPYAGGKLRTAQLAGTTIDVGAEAVIARRPEGLRLIDELGLEDRLRYPGVADARITSGGREVAVPQDTLMGVPTDVESVVRTGLLTDDGVGRLRAARPYGLTEDISVSDAVGGQLGEEVVDQLVEPLLAGVYAGRADRLSLPATIPAFRNALGTGQDVMTIARRARDAAPRSDRPVFATLQGGIGSLPDQLIEREGLSVTLGCPARSISLSGDRFVVECGAAPAPARVSTRAVVVATQPQKATKLLAGISPAASGELADVAVSSMAVVAIVYRKGDLVNTPPGYSGILVPVSEGTAVKAATYVTNKWPHVADDDLFIVRASIGRLGEEALLQRTDADLVTLARRDLAILGGISGEPIGHIVQRWAGSLPQYDVGHLARVDRIRAAIDDVPGLAVAGATYDGVGIPGCINSADAAAAKVLQHLEGDE